MLAVNNKHMHFYDGKSIEYRSSVVLEFLLFSFFPKSPRKEYQVALVQCILMKYLIIFYSGKMTSWKLKLNFMKAPSCFQLTLPECSSNFMNFLN